MEKMREDRKSEARQSHPMIILNKIIGDQIEEETLIVEADESEEDTTIDEGHSSNPNRDMIIVLP